MIHLKRTKILAAALAASLFAEPLLSLSSVTIHAQTDETFADIYRLYSYWCENDNSNFPDNVGDVYCYYYPIKLPVSPQTSNSEEPTMVYYDNYDSDSNFEVVSSPSSIQDFHVGEPVIEPIEIAADQNCVLVVGLVQDTPEAEQEILSKLQNKDQVAFTSCCYSHKEIWKVQTEISQMMMEESQTKKEQWGICGSGITCSVEEDVNGSFQPMKNYVDVMVLEEFYEGTAAMLTETYGDKVIVESTNSFPVDTVESGIGNSIGISIGIDGDFKPALTVGIDDSSQKKKVYQFLSSTKALTLGDTFTFKGNWTKTSSVIWTVKPKKKVKISSSNIRNLKIQAKKTGKIVINATNQKGNQSVSENIFILDKNGTVSNQKKLIAALNSENIKKITIKTTKEKKFTIPEGDYEDKKIIVNAPESDLYIEEQKISENLVLQKIKNIYRNETNGTVQEENKGKDIGYNNIFSFSGTILEINSTGDIALVEPDPDSDIRSSGDQVWVSLKVNTQETFSVGDRLTVLYSGGVMETYPLQIHTEMVEKDG